MQKIDYKKELKQFYKASAKNIVEVEMPEMNFLMVDGKGSPEAPAYQEVIEALYSVSYTLKFMVKKGEMGIDYGVMPLEGLWWADDLSDFVNDKKENWQYTMMIMQPEIITSELVKLAISQVKQKKELAAIDRVRFEPFKEGLSAQTLHIGPFSEEGPTVEKVHAFISGTGKKLAGKHHEIYLSDVRRAARENWKTIIRQPMS